MRNQERLQTALNRLWVQHESGEIIFDSNVDLADEPVTRLRDVIVDWQKLRGFNSRYKNGEIMHAIGPNGALCNPDLKFGKGSVLNEDVTCFACKHQLEIFRQNRDKDD